MWHVLQPCHLPPPAHTTAPQMMGRGVQTLSMTSWRLLMRFLNCCKGATADSHPAQDFTKTTCASAEYSTENKSADFYQLIRLLQMFGISYFRKKVCVGGNLKKYPTPKQSGKEVEVEIVVLRRRSETTTQVKGLYEGQNISQNSLYKGKSNLWPSQMRSFLN